MSHDSYGKNLSATNKKYRFLTTKDYFGLKIAKGIISQFFLRCRIDPALMPTTQLISVPLLCLLFRRERKSAAPQERRRPRQAQVLFWVGGGRALLPQPRKDLQGWLPDGYSQNFRLYVFGPSGFWTMAPLRYATKLDPFLSLDCAPTPSTPAQSKERKGSNFAIWQPWFSQRKLPIPLSSLLAFLFLSGRNFVSIS